MKQSQLTRNNINTTVTKLSPGEVEKNLVGLCDVLQRHFLTGSHKHSRFMIASLFASAPSSASPYSGMRTSPSTTFHNSNDSAVRHPSRSTQQIYLRKARLFLLATIYSGEHFEAAIQAYEMDGCEQTLVIIMARLMQAVHFVQSNTKENTTTLCNSAATSFGFSNNELRLFMAYSHWLDGDAKEVCCSRFDIVATHKLESYLVSAEYFATNPGKNNNLDIDARRKKLHMGLITSKTVGQIQEATVAAMPRLNSSVNYLLSQHHQSFAWLLERVVRGDASQASNITMTQTVCNAGLVGGIAKTRQLLEEQLVLLKRLEEQLLIPTQKKNSQESPCISNVPKALQHGVGTQTDHRMFLSATVADTLSPWSSLNTSNNSALNYQLQNNDSNSIYPWLSSGLPTSPALSRGTLDQFAGSPSTIASFPQSGTVVTDQKLWSASKFDPVQVDQATRAAMLLTLLKGPQNSKDTGIFAGETDLLSKSSQKSQSQRYKIKRKCSHDHMHNMHPSQLHLSSIDNIASKTAASCKTKLKKAAVKQTSKKSLASQSRGSTALSPSTPTPKKSKPLMPTIREAALAKKKGKGVDKSCFHRLVANARKYKRSAYATDVYADDPPEVLRSALLKEVEAGQNATRYWRAWESLPKEREFVKCLRELPENVASNSTFRIGRRWQFRVRGLSEVARKLGIVKANGKVDKDRLKYYKNRLKVSYGFRWVPYRNRMRGREKGEWVYCGHFGEAISKDLFFFDNKDKQTKKKKSEVVKMQSTANAVSIGKAPRKLIKKRKVEVGETPSAANSVTQAISHETAPRKLIKKTKSASHAVSIGTVPRKTRSPKSGAHKTKQTKVVTGTSVLTKPNTSGCEVA